MRTIRTHTNERILVCVYYGPNGERLINRGYYIAKVFNCPLYFLTVVPQPLEELDAQKMDYISRWQELAKEYKVAEYIIKENEKRPVTKVIAEVARQKHITQIILGQTAKSHWGRNHKRIYYQHSIKENSLYRYSYYFCITLFRRSGRSL